MSQDRLEDEYGRVGKGMKRSEALAFAEKWWDGRGRHVMLNELSKFNSIKPADRISHGGLTRVTRSPFRDIPSGIFNGDPWDQLPARDRRRVMRLWYDQLKETTRHTNEPAFILDPAAHLQAITPEDA